jgi:hypothetical protein
MGQSRLAGQGRGQNFLSHVPVMTVPPFWYVLLGEGDVRCDRPVKKMKRMGLEDGTNGRGEQVKRSKHALAQSDMGPGPPRPKRLRA